MSIFYSGPTVKKNAKCERTKTLFYNYSTVWAGSCVTFSLILHNCLLQFKPNGD